MPSDPTRPLVATSAQPPAPDSLPKTGINRAAKGTAIELTAIKILESEGYKIHRCVRTGVKRGKMYFSQSNDVFGCIDLIAKKAGERTRWIQVTADGGIGRKKNDLAEVPWDGLFDSVEIWRWVGTKRGRKDKRTGEKLDDMYFQIYRFDDNYQLNPEDRIRPA